MNSGLIIVMKQTFRSHFKTRGYWLLVLSPIIFAVVVGGIIFGVTQMQGNTTPTVAVIGNSQVRQVFIHDEKALGIKISKITDSQKANRSLTAQDLDGILTLNSENATLTTQPKSNTINKEAFVSVLGNISRSQKAASYGLTAKQTQDLIQPFNLKSVVKQSNNKSTNGENSDTANYAIGYAILQNNTMLDGIKQTFSGVTLGFTLYAIAFILIAVALYLVLTAMIASLINDNAQVQQAIQPITFLATTGYMFSFIMTNMPNNFAIKILSYVPFISQSMMPVRLVTKVETWPAAILSLVISFVTLIVLAWFGKNIYAKNVLSYSDDKIMSQLIKNIKNIKN